MKKYRTSIWLNELEPRIEKAIEKLNKKAVNRWELSSFVRHCINEELNRMGIK